MGISSSTSKSSTTPVYGSQLTGAANSVTNTYNANAPKVQGYADSVGSLVPSLISSYQNGDPATNAAENYVSSTLGSNSAENPQLEAMLRTSDANVANETNASLGTRGLTGGTVQQDILSRNLAQNDTAMRYQDYTAQQAQKQAAAGIAPSLSAAKTISIAPAISAATTAAGLPLSTADQYAAGIGGLLGQYTNTTQKSSPSLLSSLGQIASAASLFV